MRLEGVRSPVEEKDAKIVRIQRIANDVGDLLDQFVNLECIGGGERYRVKNRKLLQLALQGSLVFFFLGDIKQDTLPIKWVSICITNEARIFLDPDDSCHPA